MTPLLERPPQSLIDEAWKSHFGPNPTHKMGYSKDRVCIYHGEDAQTCCLIGYHVPRFFKELGALAGTLQDFFYQEDPVLNEQITAVLGIDVGAYDHLNEESDVWTDAQDDQPGLRFLAELQIVHDDAASASFSKRDEEGFVTLGRENLRNLCIKYDLKYPGNDE